MRVLLVVMGATGMLLVYLGATSPPPRSTMWTAFDRVGNDAGLPSWGARKVVACCIGGALGAVVGTAVLTSSSIVMFIAAISGGWAPIGWLKSRVRKRRVAHRDVWPEAIALLTSGVRAGISLPEVVASLADRGPETLQPYFHRFRATYRSSSSFEIALETLADDLADPIADRIVSALKLADRVGGTDLVRVLRALSDFVREDLRVRREVEARWSWTVTAARLAAAAPWLVLVVMSSRPEAAAAYDSANGMMLVVGGAAATLVGYRMMLRAARLPGEKRWRP